jgi:hypothetical protein
VTKIVVSVELLSMRLWSSCPRGSKPRICIVVEMIQLQTVIRHDHSITLETVEMNGLHCCFLFVARDSEKNGKINCQLKRITFGAYVQ